MLLFNPIGAAFKELRQPRAGFVAGGHSHLRDMVARLGQCPTV